jgi:hypothetical protein
MGLTPEQEAAYAISYGLSRSDLKPEVRPEYDRLLAERRAGAQATTFSFTFSSMGEPFTILTPSGRVGYEARPVADVAEHLALRVVGGAQVMTVVRDASTGGFRVLAGSEQVALVGAKSLLRRRYYITEAAGEPVVVTGDVYAGWYEFRANGENGITGVQVVREQIVRPISTRINVQATIADGRDYLRCLAIVLAIEYLAEDRRQSFSELGLRREW